MLIEAGRKDDCHSIHIPVGYLYCIGNPRTDWFYQTESDAGLNGRTAFKVQGVTTLNTLANSLWGKAKIGLEYALRRSGPMIMAPSQLGAFTRSTPDQAHPNLEYHVQPLTWTR